VRRKVGNRAGRVKARVFSAGLGRTPAHAPYAGERAAASARERRAESPVSKRTSGGFVLCPCHCCVRERPKGKAS